MVRNRFADAASTAIDDPVAATTNLPATTCTASVVYTFSRPSFGFKGYYKERWHDRKAMDHRILRHSRERWNGWIQGLLELRAALITSPHPLTECKQILKDRYQSARHHILSFHVVEAHNYLPSLGLSVPFDPWLPTPIREINQRVVL